MGEVSNMQGYARFNSLYRQLLMRMPVLKMSKLRAIAVFCDTSSKRNYARKKGECFRSTILSFIKKKKFVLMLHGIWTDSDIILGDCTVKSSARS